MTLGKELLGRKFEVVKAEVLEVGDTIILQGYPIVLTEVRKGGDVDYFWDGYAGGRTVQLDRLMMREMK